MPFGRKPAGNGRLVEFDVVYEELIKPAVIKADLEPLRADEEQVGGVIHKAMFERLILCEYAVADLTTANANVFYELGLRHAVRRWATILLFADGWGQLPFDVHSLRALPYVLAKNGTPANTLEDSAALTERLRSAQSATPDSPVFQLVEEFPDIQRLKTDVFRDRVRYAKDVQKKLVDARTAGLTAVEDVETELGEISQADAGVVVDLYLSYRALKAWQSMVDLVDRMSPPLAASLMVREQLALALNRLGRSEDAERELISLIDERGPSSETYGILGRVYKDRWEIVANAGDSALARGLLDKAINAYLKGFEADWRDAYPGVNTVTLMELKEDPDPRQEELLPVVVYAVEQRIGQSQPDYWDYASRLELAILARDEKRAGEALANALAHVRESWEPETTARNLRMIRKCRAHRGEDITSIEEAERSLNDRAGLQAE